MSRDLVLCLVVLLAAAVLVHGGERLDVHLVPHSHCDPGWKSTYHQYFVNQVSHILDSVLVALKNGNQQRRFIWSEIAYFQPWYESLDRANQLVLQELVRSGRFEFVGGGWVQHDETLNSFDAVIHQVTEGRLFIQKHFGVKPRVGWQIDTFGHSRLTAWLAEQLQLDELVINRMDYRVKERRRGDKAMQFVWEGMEDTAVLTHILDEHYSSPKGFDLAFDNEINSSNVAQKADLFMETVLRQAGHYRSNVLMLPIGDDFRFWNAPTVFVNYERLLDFINSPRGQERYGRPVTIKFATLSEFFDALRGQVDTLTLPRFSGDFLPYTHEIYADWTGYYSNHPKLKATIRTLEDLTRSADLVFSMALIKTGRSLSSEGGIDFCANNIAAGSPKYQDPLEILQESYQLAHTSSTATASQADVGLLACLLVQAKRAVWLMPHHDTITGTSKQHVITDQFVRSALAQEAFSHVICESLKLVLGLPADAHLNTISLPPVPFPEKSTVAVPQASKERPIVKAQDGGNLQSVVVFNPLSFVRQEAVTVRVSTPFVTAITMDNTKLPVQVQPTLASLHKLIEMGCFNPVEIVRVERCDNWIDLEAHFIVHVPPLSSVTVHVSVYPEKQVNSPNSPLVSSLPSIQFISGPQNPFVMRSMLFDSADEPEWVIQNAHLRVWGRGGSVLGVEQGDAQEAADPCSSDGRNLSRLSVERLLYENVFSGAYIFRIEVGLVLLEGLARGSTTGLLVGIVLLVLVFQWRKLKSASGQPATLPIHGKTGTDEPSNLRWRSSDWQALTGWWKRTTAPVPSQQLPRQQGQDDQAEAKLTLIQLSLCFVGSCGGSWMVGMSVSSLGIGLGSAEASDGTEIVMTLAVLALVVMSGLRCRRWTGALSMLLAGILCGAFGFLFGHIAFPHLVSTQIGSSPSSFVSSSSSGRSAAATTSFVLLVRGAVSESAFIWTVSTPPHAHTSDDALHPTTVHYAESYLLYQSEPIVRVTVQGRPNENAASSVRFHTDLVNRRYFWTDDGAQWTQRHYSHAAAITGNIYPSISRAAIRDDDRELQIFLTQSMGVTSACTGCLELLLHRRPMRDDGQGLEEGIIDKRWHDAHLWLSLGKPLAKQEADVLALRIKHPLVAMMLSESSPETAIPEACLSIGEATSHHHLLSFSALDAARCTNSGLFAYEVDTSATLVAARVENVDRMFLPVVSSLSFLPNFEDLFTSDNVKVKGKDYDLAWKRLAVAIGEENMTVTNAAIAVKSSSVEYYKSDQSNIKTGALNQCSDLPWPSATLDVCHWRDLLHNPSCGWVLGSRGWWTFIVLGGIFPAVFIITGVYISMPSSTSQAKKRHND